MTPNRPYLIRAIFDWLLDNEQTPYLLVDADGDGVVVPRQYVEDGRIVLNISPTAVRDLELGNSLISFNARFGGSPMSVMIPPPAVMGIYSRENGQGMLFPADAGVDDDAGEGPDGPDDSPEPPRPSGGRPSLKVVK